MSEGKARLAHMPRWAAALRLLTVGLAHAPTKSGLALCQAQQGTLPTRRAFDTITGRKTPLAQPTLTRAWVVGTQASGGIANRGARDVISPNVHGDGIVEVPPL